jgi:hypothetical protein
MMFIFDANILLAKVVLEGAVVVEVELIVALAGEVLFVD